MFAYCVGELRLSEDAAAKRIQAARVGRRFPAVFHAVSAGRLHLTGVGLLAPHLTEATAAGLLGAAMHKTKAEIEQLLAERFPQPDVLAWVAEMTGSPGTAQPGQHAPAHVENHPDPESVPAQHAPGHVGDRPRVKPLSSESFALQLTMSRSTHDKLRHAQQLLGHQFPSGDVATVLDRALDALIERLEKRKFAATSRPGRGARRGEAREVEKSRAAVACAHVGKARTAERAPATAERPEAPAADHAPIANEDRDGFPWLRHPGFSAAEARRGAAHCEHIPDASLEQRLRLAMTCIGVRGTRMGRAGAPST